MSAVSRFGPGLTLLLLTAWFAWTAWRAGTTGVFRWGATTYSRREEPISYWFFTGALALMVMLFVLGVVIRGPESLVSG